MRPRLVSLLTALVGLALALPASGQMPGAVDGAGTVVVPAGRYWPLYATPADTAGVAVASFVLDVHPVTVEDFAAFVAVMPRWQRDAAPSVLTDDAYMASWRDASTPAHGAPHRPVTEVSWFAARAYCAWTGGRLPTTDQWEYAAQASEAAPNAFRDAAFNRHVLALYQARAPMDSLPAVETTDRNALGVADLHGLVWEWTDDFNNQMLTGAGRDDRSLDRQLFCAAGSSGATDLTNYAGFLRWAYRLSLQGTTSAPGLGFRCAR